jgi:ribonuclease J
VLSVLRRKLGEAGMIHEVRLLELPPGGRVKLGPFDCGFIPVTHSIPEAQALVLRTPYGLVLHTGDWKLDPQPLIGSPTDESAFAKLGEEGVLAMVCDSTNAMVEGHSGSEAEVRASLTDLIKGLKGRIAVTCFASNVARLESIAVAGRAAGRQVALLGRSLRNMEASARECGFLKSLPPFLDEEEAGFLPDDEILLICTGSQGEPRSAMAKIAEDKHPAIALGEGDTVIFSSRQIPGNEVAIQRVQDGLVRRGCRVITDEQAMVHVSGHPAREELRRLYDLVKPRIAVPVHGEWRHMQEHADLARTTGAKPILLNDGDVLRLSGNRAEVVEAVPTGRLAVDGDRLLPLDGDVIAARRRMMFNGVVLASIALDRQGRVLGDPMITAPGLFAEQDAEPGLVAAELRRTIADLPAGLRDDDETLRESLRAALRKALGRRFKKRPNVEIHVIRV